MPFRFSMQKVLDYREQLEEEAKVRLAKAEQQRNETRERLDIIRRDLMEQEERLYTRPPSGAGERWLLEHFVRGLKADMAATAVQLRAAESMVEESRKILATRAMDRKILDKLKERQKELYMHDERMKEQRFNDEIATLRYKAPTF